MHRRPNSLTVLKWVIYVSFLGALVPVIWKWTDPASFSVFNKDDIVEAYGGYARLALWQRFAGFSVNALPQACLAYALYCLWRLIQQLEAGDWFGQKNESFWRAIGQAMLWYAVANWLGETLLILVLTATNGPGHRELTVSISNYDVLGLIPALMAFVIARMVSLARAQRDELNEIV